MKKTLVVNTSPLIYLAKLDRLYFLDDFKIIIPRPVVDELFFKDSTETELLREFLQEKHVSVASTKILRSLPDYLGAGEKAVISLALEKKLKAVVLDDRRAVSVAEQHGLAPKGTLAILITMKEREVISEMESIAILQSLCEKGFRVSTNFLVAILQRLFGK
jgi:predicted nucleic acid-binding protein